MPEPNIIKVILIRTISKYRYEYIGEVLRRNDGSIIKLGGTKYCTGMSTGVEVFNVDGFTDSELAKILSSDESS